MSLDTWDDGAAYETTSTTIGSRFPGGQGPAPGYMTGLSDARREQLRANIQQRLHSDDAGRIPLIARVWALRGLVA